MDLKNNNSSEVIYFGTVLLLLGLSFLILKPIMMSLVAGVILAFIFSPIYRFFLKRFKSESLCASIVLILSIVLIAIPVWLLVPVLLKQSIQIFIASQQIDLVTPLKMLLPSIFSEPGTAAGSLSESIGPVMKSFLTGLTSSTMNSISNLLLNFPEILLQSFMVFFTFFFVLKDGERFLDYLKSVLPFPKKIEENLFKSSRDITFSVLYGQVLIGFLQGLLVGLGFWIFGVENALFLTILACLAGVLPVIGATVVWIPVILYMLFTGGDTWAVFGITVFGILGSFFENSVKPILVSRKTNVHSAVILIGMVGGIFLFGILGFILGPLILEYLLILLEVYRDRKSPGVLISNN